MSYNYIRIPPSGRPEFVRSNSFSHHHHHHHRHHSRRCFDDCASVSVAEYNNLLEQNANFREANGLLQREKETLKAEIHNLRVGNQSFINHNARLTEENKNLRNDVADLRRSVSVEDDQIDAFKKRIKTLKSELDKKEREVRHLARDRDVLEQKAITGNEIAHQWKAKFDELKRNYDNVKHLLRVRDAELLAKEAELDERNSTNRRLRDLLERYRGW